MVRNDKIVQFLRSHVAPLLVTQYSIFFLFLNYLHKNPIIGSAMSLGSCFKQLFQQLEIYEEFKKIGKPNHTMELYNTELKPIFVLDYTAREKM